MNNFDEYENYDGLGLADLVRTGQVTAAELTEAAITRIERDNSIINAVVHKMYDYGRDLAQSPDAESPFAGVPTVLKDLGYEMAGFPMSNGSRAYKNHVPNHDSEMVARFKQSGLVILGKSNTPELGLLGITEPEVFGPCRNPWNTEHTPGGSSGGAAAAVAAGWTPIAPAGDGGGSIRIPAANTGLFGLKPTRGRTPSGPIRGSQWMGAAISHVITRSVRDSAAMLDATLGHDVGASFQTPLPNRPYLEEVARMPGKLKIAFNTNSPLGTPVHPDCVKAVEQTAKLLEGMGHHVEEAVPEVDGQKIAKSYVALYFGEIAAQMMEIQQFLGRRPTKRDIELGTLALGTIGEAVSAGYMLDQLHYWGLAARQMGRFFERYDLYLTPTTASPPVKIGALAPKPAEQFVLNLVSSLKLGKLLVRSGLIDKMAIDSLQHTPFTQIANLCGLPGMSVPLSQFENGLPLGVQFIAPFGREDRLFNLAGQLEQERPWVAKRPS
ncbi:MAG: amidase [Anaerolineae bacterium]